MKKKNPMVVHYEEVLAGVAKARETMLEHGCDLDGCQSAKVEIALIEAECLIECLLEDWNCRMKDPKYFEVDDNDD